MINHGYVSAPLKIEIHIVKIMVDGIIILQCLLQKDSLTHTTQQSSSSVLGGLPVPQFP